MALKGEVYRMTIATEEILGLLESLSCLTSAQLTTGARSIQKKFQLQAAKINLGAATPAYVTTGTGAKKQGVTLADLGGSEEEFNGTHIPESLSPADLQMQVQMQVQMPGMPGVLGEELSPELEAELERLNRQMLAELAGNGAGAQNVVLTERRKVSREVSRTSELVPTFSVNDL